MVAKPSAVAVPEKIITQATRLFASRGFDATSLQDIASAVGVTKQAVLHHYPSKEHVRLAVLGGIVTHWNETLPRLLLATTASDDRFHAVLGELQRFFGEDADRARLVVREVLDRPEAVRALIKTVVTPWLDAVSGYIARGQLRGEHHADMDPEAYVVHVLNLVIVGAATSQVMTVALTAAGAPKPAKAQLRFDREIVRIARASLFSREESPPSKKKRKV